MTNSDIAELRGEIYGLKILLVNCLSFISAHTTDADNHLDTILNDAVQGIASAKNDKVKPAHLPIFRAASAGIVSQVTQAAKIGARQVPRQETLQ